MPNPRKNPPTLTDTDLSVKRIIGHYPATIADIAYILHMTSGQVRASIEKLVARNEVMSHPYVDSAGRRNIYYPKLPINRNQTRAALKTTRAFLNEGWDQQETLEDKLDLLQALDKHYKMLYNGVAGLVNMRKEAE